jgi:hypothetical protein
VRLLGGTRLHAAIVLTLYFGATVTNPTIYYWIMFTPSDILAFGALVVMLAGVNFGWSPAKLGLTTMAVAALAVFTKENGIAASGGVLLLTLCFWQRLTARHRGWLFSSQMLLLTVYLGSYGAYSAGKWMTLGEFSPAAAQTHRHGRTVSPLDLARGQYQTRV